MKNIVYIILSLATLLMCGTSLALHWDEDGAGNMAVRPLSRVIIYGRIERTEFYIAYDSSTARPPFNVERYYYMTLDQYDEYLAQQEVIAANRKTPACERERQFMEAVREAGLGGKPLGSQFTFLDSVVGFVEDLTDFLSGGVRDPDYQGSEWRKMSISVQYFDLNVQKPVLMTAHYWWNMYTNSVRDLKLKNTPFEGCQGQQRLA